MAPGPLELDFFAALGLEGIFARVWTLFKHRWGTFLVIHTISVLIHYTLATIFAVYTIGRFNYDGYQSTLYTNPVWWAVLAVEFVLYYTIQCLADGTSIRIVAEMYTHKVPQLLPAAHCALMWLGHLLLACLMLASVILLPLGFVLLLLAILPLSATVVVNLMIIFGIIFAAYAVYICVVTYHTYSVIMVEKSGAWQSIQRSKNLITHHGHFAHVLMVLFLWFVCRLVVNGIVTSLLHSNTGYDSDGGARIDFTFGSAGDSIVSIAFAIFFAALNAIFQAVVYFDVRTKSEGYTVDMLEQDLGGAEASSYANMDNSDNKGAMV